MRANGRRRVALGALLLGLIAAAGMGLLAVRWWRACAEHDARVEDAGLLWRRAEFALRDPPSDADRAHLDAMEQECLRTKHELDVLGAAAPVGYHLWAAVAGGTQ